MSTQNPTNPQSRQYPTAAHQQQQQFPPAAHQQQQQLPLAAELEAAPPPAPEADATSVVAAVLRRWPWVLVCAAGGLLAGLLVHSRLPPAYQSGAQLLVIRNRIESSTGQGAADSRVAYVEDYVETQLSLIRSRKILQVAAQKIDEQGSFESPPPAAEADRVAILSGGLSVAREKDSGASYYSASSVLALSFRCGNSADAPRYLRAVIAAYQSELTALYEEATAKQLARLDADIEAMTNDWGQMETRRVALLRESKGVTQEDLPGVTARITSNRTALNESRLRKSNVDRDLAIVARTGRDRGDRLATLDRLGLRPDLPGRADARTPEGEVLALKLQREELGTRLGPDHPDMLALETKIRHLTLLQTGGKGEDLPGRDELDRHRLKLEADRDALEDQIRYLTNAIAEDEAKASSVGSLQDEIDRLKVNMTRLDERLKERRGERGQVAATKAGGGFRAEDINPPGPGAQVAPVLNRSLGLGGFAGLLLGVALCFLAERADRGFRNAAEIRRVLGVAVVEHIPWIRTDAPIKTPSGTGLSPLLATFYRPASAEAEAYRKVRTQLYFSTLGRGHQMIQVTSPNPGDGKSTLAANLAISVAQSGKRVALVDCDFRKPRVHKLFNVERPGVGFASVVAGLATLDEATQATEVANLWLIPCGPRPSNPAELLTGARFQEVLAELRGRFDFVILDTPPVRAVSDPLAVAPRADGVVLVLQLKKDSRPAAQRTREEIAAVGAKVLAVVVNAAPAGALSRGGYSYGGTGYGYEYEYQYTEDYRDAEEVARA